MAMIQPGQQAAFAFQALVQARPIQPDQLDGGRHDKRAVGTLGPVDRAHAALADVFQEPPGTQAGSGGQP